MAVELTKNADKMLCEIYATYLNRLDSGEPSSDAEGFERPEKWPEQSWRTADGKSSISELVRAGMLRENITGGFRLTQEAVVYMRSRFGNKASNVFEWLAKIKSAIPFA